MKVDQCRMVMQCSHLFWKKILSAEMHHKVVECLQRALKTADSCPAGYQFGLFVEALNHYGYYYNAQMNEVSAKAVQALVDMANEAVSSAEDKAAEQYLEAKVYLKNTIKMIKERQEAGDELWNEVNV